MKSHFKLFSVFLSIIIAYLSMFQCNMTVYASSGGGHSRPGDNDNDKFLGNYDNIGDFLLQEADKLIAYVVGQTKAIYSGDFSTVVQNDELFDEYFNPDHITYSDDVDGKGTPGIVFDEDLTAYMKQALIEYAEETNGFRLYPTIDYDLVPASEFKSSYDYKTFCNLVSEAGCIVLNTGYFNGRISGLYFGRPFHDIEKDSISLVNGNTLSGFIIVDARFYGTNTWTWYGTPVKRFATQYIDSDGYSSFRIFTSWEEGADVPSQVATNISSGLLDIRGLYPTGSAYGNTFFSTDGRKLKVFNSLNALKNYTVGSRSVYFGSGFYEDTGEIQVSFDDLEKYIDGKYDSFFDDLKDLIGDNEDNLTEEDLEKLVDKILDKMDDIGGNNKPGDNTGDNSGILDGISDALEGITSTISGYLDAILMYLESILTDLDYIVMQYQDMTEEDAKTKTDSALNELKGTFSEVGDMMTKKFPFCIPWDLKQLFVTLNGGKDYSGEDAAMLLSGGDIEGYAAATPENPELPTFSGYTGSGKLVDVIIYSSPSSRASPSSGENGIMMLSADDTGNGGTTGNDTAGADAGVYRSESGAPVFHIPFVLNSIGLNSALVIDMSPFDGVSDISRTLFLLIFIYQLILLSIRITEFLEGFIG